MKKQISVKHTYLQETRKSRGNGNQSLIGCRFRFQKCRAESGVALVMILLIISLAGFIVVDLTHTSYLDIRSNLIAERSLRAEYYLKSAINFGRGLLLLDTTPGTDGLDEPWAPFAKGAQRLPLELLGIEAQGLAIDMVILPLNTSIAIHDLATVGSGSSGINSRELLRDTLTRLIYRVFENSPDNLADEEDPQYDNRQFNPEGMVANLIDYMDTDDPNESRSYSSYGRFTYEGIEDQFAEDYFPNQPISSLQELSNIPGWTDARVAALSPFLYAFPTRATSSGSTGRSLPNSEMNINFLKEQIILSVADDLDISAFQEVDAIRNNTSEGPLTDGRIQNEITQILGSESPYILTIVSKYFVIKARVTYGDTSTIMTATVYRDNGSGADGYPTIVSQEIY